MYKIQLIDKPTGISSYDVIRKIKQQYSHLPKKGPGRFKIGHAGTLDPFASGLLILLLGDATKEFAKFQTYHKTYLFTLKLGLETDTLDITGKITEKKNIPQNITKEQIEKALQSFVGEIEQIPPKYSAIHVNGQRAYKLARQGKDFDIPKRAVHIYKLKLLEWDTETATMKLEAVVSSGTYIRVLGADIARKLKTLGIVTELRRTRIGEYRVEDAEKIVDD